MSKITQEEDGSYHWSCSIDKDDHQKAGRRGLWGVVITCAAAVLIFLITSHGTNAQNDLWILLLVIGVILVIALPLLFLWNSAEDPHEQYVMTEDYVKSGYGKSAVFSQFKNMQEVIVTARYIELKDKQYNNRVFIPPDDMDFVREYILQRIPEDAVIHRG